MTKTRAVTELRRVLERLQRASRLYGSCIDKEHCTKKVKAKDRCVVCDANHVLKYSERAIS